MLNIIELEKKWLRYKIKIYLPYIIGTLSISIIITIILNFNMFNKETTKKDNLVSKTKEINKLVPEKPIVKQKIETKIEKDAMKPSFEFMDNFKTHTYTTKKEVYKKQTILPQKVTEVVLDIKEPAKIDNNKLNIKRENTEENIKQVIKRFTKNNNPILSLFIAKKYYELKNYKQAYQYAFLTNEINDKIEDSWIIFIKSMIKLGQKDKAIQTLKKYINHSNSSKAKVLLEDISSGRFR